MRHFATTATAPLPDVDGQAPLAFDDDTTLAAVMCSRAGVGSLTCAELAETLNRVAYYRGWNMLAVASRAGVLDRADAGKLTQLHAAVVRLLDDSARSASYVRLPP